MINYIHMPSMANLQFMAKEKYKTISEVFKTESPV